MTTLAKPLKCLTPKHKRAASIEPHPFGLGYRNTSAPLYAGLADEVHGFFFLYDLYRDRWPALPEPSSRHGSDRPFDYIDVLESVANFSAGFGDMLTFGLTKLARRNIDPSLIDTSSGAYIGGEATGFVVSVAMGATGGLRATGSRMAGREFSHWIPHRFLKGRGRWLARTFGRSRFNGNFVTPARHYLHDAFRYPAGWRQLGPRLPRFLQQLDRVPRLYYGTAAGVGWGLGGAYLANEIGQ
jgi:hypothetical protein